MTKPTASARAAVREFVTLILHGDDAHKLWLRTAGEAFCYGLPIPLANGAGVK